MKKISDIEIKDIIESILLGKLKITVFENTNVEKYDTIIHVDQDVYGTKMVYTLYINPLKTAEEITQDVLKQLKNTVNRCLFQTKKY